jgi:hypothetical protein
VIGVTARLGRRLDVAAEAALGVGRIGSGFNVVTGPARLQVGADDADDAREVLADLIAGQNV